MTRVESSRQAAVNRTRALIRTNWVALTDWLKTIEDERGSAEMLRALNEQQAVQFVIDHLAEVTRYRLPAPADPDRAFQIQYNPVRARRSGGAGRNDPPPRGWSDDPVGCRLCEGNVQWAQPAQFGYELHLEGRSKWLALAQPFPLALCHFTLASRVHIPQEWVKKECIQTIVRSLLQLERALGPDWIVFYNGLRAGATIPDHRHLQCFERPAGRISYPLEQALASASKKGRFVVRDYPAPFVACTGRIDAITKSLIASLSDWIEFSGDAATANLIVTHPPKTGQMTACFFPRHKNFSGSPGLAGHVASLELLGELVFSTEDERKRLESGQIDYQAVEQILASVRPPDVGAFLAAH